MNEHQETTQLRFFPALLPDETLFSAIARYHVNSGNTTLFDTRKQLIGSEALTAGRLSEVIKSLSKKVADRMHVPESTIMRAYENSIGICGAEHVYFNERLIRVVLRPANSCVLTPSMELQYHPKTQRLITPIAIRTRRCARCAEADLENYGVAYWHRSHQHPVATACHIHWMPLERDLDFFGVEDPISQLYSFPSAVKKSNTFNVSPFCRAITQVITAMISVSRPSNFKEIQYMGHVVDCFWFKWKYDLQDFLDFLEPLPGINYLNWSCEHRSMEDFVESIKLHFNRVRCQLDNYSATESLSYDRRSGADFKLLHLYQLAFAVINGHDISEIIRMVCSTQRAMA